jgi:hypothetical protein
LAKVESQGFFNKLPAGISIGVVINHDIQLGRHAFHVLSIVTGSKDVVFASTGILNVHKQRVTAYA